MFSPFVFVWPCFHKLWLFWLCPISNSPRLLFLCYCYFDYLFEWKLMSWSKMNKYSVCWNTFAGTLLFYRREDFRSSGHFSSTAEKFFGTQETLIAQIGLYVLKNLQLRHSISKWRFGGLSWFNLMQVLRARAWSEISSRVVYCWGILFFQMLHLNCLFLRLWSDAAVYSRCRIFSLCDLTPEFPVCGHSCSQVCYECDTKHSYFSLAWSILE